jgi:multiple sugar transport system ATP-binding protein
MDAPGRYRDHVGKSVLFGIRPEHLGEDAGGAGLSDIVVEVALVEPLGMETLVHGRVGASEVIARCSPSVCAAPGQPLRLSVAAGSAALFDAKTERAL